MSDTMTRLPSPTWTLVDNDDGSHLIDLTWRIVEQGAHDSTRVTFFYDTKKGMGVCRVRVRNAKPTIEDAEGADGLRKLVEWLMPGEREGGG